MNFIMEHNFQFGFTLDKSINDGMNPYLDGHQDDCALQPNSPSGEVVIFIKFDLKNEK